MSEANSVTRPFPPQPRLQSLDALRGFDMFWIISGEGIFHGLAGVVKAKHGLVQSTYDYTIAAGSADLNFAEKIAIGISNQLHHTPWNGFSFYDLIFPLFIFVAGVSMPYAYSKLSMPRGVALEPGTKRKIYFALIKRTVVLILLGMVVNGLLQWHDYGQTRFASVLGRIALSCFFAAVIFLNNSLRGQIIWFVAILLGYWAVMIWVPVPGFGAAVLTPDGNMAAYIDRLFLPGKLHRVVYDPEGLLSTVPAVCSALLGVFAGTFLRSYGANLTMKGKAGILVLSAVVFIAVGWALGLVFPINKNMWTSSFVLYAGGWSLLFLAVFYLVIDIWGYRKWAMPFVWTGMNSILIYLLAHGMFDFEFTSRFLFGGLISFAAAVWHPALLWVGVAIVQFTLLYFLYRKRWLLKV